MQFILLVLVAVLFVASPNLLYMTGIGYLSATGSQLEKIHPALFVAALALVYAGLVGARVNPRLRGSRRSAIVLAFAAMISIVVFILNSEESGGGELSALVVTYFMPAMMVLALSYARDATLERITRAISLFFIANSAMCLFEIVTGFRLLPFVAGNEIITFDNRPTAFLGHPLNNALLTGAWLLILLMRSLAEGFRPWPLLNILLLLIALLAFGGRASFVVCLLLFCGFAIYNMFRAFVAGGGAQELLRLIMIVLISLSMAPVVIWSGVADTIVARFIDSAGSNETRSAALDMLYQVDTGQLFTGLPLSSRTAMQSSMGSEHGIELSWIALLLTFGAPIAILLLLSTVYLLLCVGRGGGAQTATLLLYFVVTTFTSLSIASKTLLISQFAAILICAGMLRLRTPQHRVQRISAPDLYRRMPVATPRRIGRETR